MRVVIANFSAAPPTPLDYAADWQRRTLPPQPARVSLFEQAAGWGFHIYALGVYLLDKGVADAAEFWAEATQRSVKYRKNGVLRVHFSNTDDALAYLDRYGCPDLFINYGRHGEPLLRALAGRCFRVHIPCTRYPAAKQDNAGAECYLVDAAEDLTPRSMLYIPVVHGRRIFPTYAAKERDFIYLASVQPGKRHDLLLNAVRGTELTGHLHPVDPSALDVSGTHITTSNWNERDIVELLRTSRIAVYPGDRTSNPAAMWECVAAGLPIVVNRNIAGGRHVVVPGVTGEFAGQDDLAAVMRDVLAHREAYRPRQHYEEHWDTVRLLDSYLSFFSRIGWTP